MHTLPVTFRSAAGATLSGRLELPPNGEATASALVVHCFTCGKDATAVVQVARALARERLAVLRFDFTGLGESEGDFSGTHFSSNLADIQAAAAFMAERG